MQTPWSDLARFYNMLVNEVLCVKVRDLRINNNSLQLFVDLQMFFNCLCTVVLCCTDVGFLIWLQCVLYEMMYVIVTELRGPTDYRLLTL